MRIGLSFHAGTTEYDRYAGALIARGKALDLAIEPIWLAGKGLATLILEQAQVAGVVFTGGADVEPSRYGRAEDAHLCRVDSARDAIEWAFLEQLDKRDIPLLAICRGAQLLNVYRGGTLIADLGALNDTHKGAKDRLHPVSLAAGSRLGRLPGSERGEVNSSHHQAVDRLADGFVVTARAPDGTVEGYERADPGQRRFLLAVQWHPEAMRLDLPLAGAVLDDFLNACRVP